MTRTEVLQLEKECERSRDFHKHVDPIDFNNYYPVDENFHYYKVGFREKFKYFMLHTFVVNPTTWYLSNFYMKAKVYGRENLKGIKNAIVTCNHVYKFDCLLSAHGLKGHKLYITSAEFNNQKGRFGDYMRAGGLMPFSDNLKAMRNLNSAISKRLQTKNYVLFYPEESMWWMYEKPRPYKNGAYHYAVKNDVPVIPMFITFKLSDKKDEEGIPLRKFHLHIMKPIYPDPALSHRENIEAMRDKNFEMCKTKYEEFYNKKMKYED